MENNTIPEYDRIKEIKHFEEKNFKQYLADKIYDEEMGSELLGTTGWWSNFWEPYEEIARHEDDRNNL